MWPYIAGDLKGHLTQKITLWEQMKRSYNQGLKIQSCKIEGLLYSICSIYRISTLQHLHCAY